MTAIDWGRFAEAAETAERQFQANAPLPLPAARLGIGDALTAAQPVVAKLSAFVTTRPGAIAASLTMLAEMKRQGFIWAGELEDILSAAANALPTASADLAEAISVINEFLSAPDPSGGMGVRVGRG